jgi:hypothetical protein
VCSRRSVPSRSLHVKCAYLILADKSFTRQNLLPPCKRERPRGTSPTRPRMSVVEKCWFFGAKVNEWEPVGEVNKYCLVLQPEPLPAQGQRQAVGPVRPVAVVASHKPDEPAHTRARKRREPEPHRQELDNRPEHNRRRCERLADSNTKNSTGGSLHHRRKHRREPVPEPLVAARVPPGQRRQSLSIHASNSCHFLLLA